MRLLTSTPRDGAADLDEAAFGRLFEANAQDLYGFCFRRLADGRAAEDLVQVVFLEAWRRRTEAGVREDDMRPWLFGVALNVVRNHRRSLRRHAAALQRLPRPREDHDLGDDLVRRLDDERRAAAALERFGAMPRPEQDVIALCSWGELTYEEAAGVLGIPVGTVRSRLSRARTRLTTELAAIDEEGL